MKAGEESPDFDGISGRAPEFVSQQNHEQTSGWWEPPQLPHSIVLLRE